MAAGRTTVSGRRTHEMFDWGTNVARWDVRIDCSARGHSRPLAPCDTADSTGTDGGTTHGSNGGLPDARGSGTVDEHARTPDQLDADIFVRDAAGPRDGELLQQPRHPVHQRRLAVHVPSLRSVQLPDCFTGAVSNPEAWNGSSPLKVVAMTTPSYQLHGNYCWLNGAVPSAAGSVVITEFRPNDVWARRR